MAVQGTPCQGRGCTCCSSDGSRPSPVLPLLEDTAWHLPRALLPPDASREEKTGTTRIVPHVPRDEVLVSARAMAARGAGAPWLTGEDSGISYAPMRVVCVDTSAAAGCTVGSRGRGGQTAHEGGGRPVSRRL